MRLGTPRSYTSAPSLRGTCSGYGGREQQAPTSVARHIAFSVPDDDDDFEELRELWTATPGRFELHATEAGDGGLQPFDTQPQQAILIDDDVLAQLACSMLACRLSTFPRCAWSTSVARPPCAANYARNIAMSTNPLRRCANIRGWRNWTPQLGRTLNGGGSGVDAAAWRHERRSRDQARAEVAEAVTR
jgi:hypothetical protein